MQTFLPYSSFKQSAKCLDYRRLGNQRVESRHILKTLANGGSYKNHPAVRMWEGFEAALTLYMNTCIKEWIARGYNNTMQIMPVPSLIEKPYWLGCAKFHASHRSALLYKNYEYYRQFKWEEPAIIQYFWPTKNFAYFNVDK